MTEAAGFRLRRPAAWLSLTVAVLALKLALAGRLDLFGDEAFYRWESLHPAPGYSDVPPLTPWLIGLGNAIFGPHILSGRVPFVLLSALVPVLVYRLARTVAGRAEAERAALLSFAIPLAAVGGVLALPDVPLTVAMLGAMHALARLLRRDRWRDALLLGIWLAIGWLSHYRVVLLYLSGFAIVLASVPGRRLLRTPKAWAALAIGLAGLMPALWHEFATQFAAMKFQFVDRHPWRFHADGLLEPLVQAVVTTPVMFALLLLVPARHLRAEGQGEDPRHALRRVFALAALGMLVGTLALVCFADDTRLRLHWFVPAYLFALPLLPAALATWRERGRWRRSCARVAAPIGWLGSVLAFGWLAVAAAGPDWRPVDGRRLMPDNLVGWREVSSWAERERLAIGADAVPIADNFLLAAEWLVAMPAGLEPYVLEHPLNAKHGRAAQLALWARDEPAMQSGTWERGLLVVEESAVRAVEVLPHFRSLCGRFATVSYRGDLAVSGTRDRFLAFAVTRGRDAERAGRCRLPPIGYLDHPAPTQPWRGASQDVAGWASVEFIGIGAVEVLIDGVPMATARYGLAAPQVRGQWPDSNDPGHPNVGYEATVPLDAIGLGQHALAIVARDREGRSRVVARRIIERVP